MSEPTWVGDPMPERAERDRISEMSLTLTPLDLIAQWQRCSTTADFLATYLCWHFENRANANQVLSGGLNELVENLAKFSADKRAPVELTVTHLGEHLRVRTRNQAHGAQARALASRLTRMAESDPEELFLEQLEHTAAHDRGASGLGLITIKKDYGARVGARITPVEGANDLFTITLTLELDVDAIEAA